MIARHTLALVIYSELTSPNKEWNRVHGTEEIGIGVESYSCQEYVTEHQLSIRSLTLR